MKRIFWILVWFAACNELFAQCTINVNATGAPLIICPGQQVQLNASVTPNTCGLTASCPGNNQATPIGSGTTAQPGTFATAPTLLGNFERSARNQMLYLASELNGALGGPCVIRVVAFNIAIFNSNAFLQNFTIKMGCTNATSLNNWENNLTTVYAPGIPYQPQSAWLNSFVLTTPFAWDGVSNIVIDICWYNPSTWGNQNNKAQCTTTAFNSYLFLTGGSDLCNTALPPNVSTIRPNVRFNYCYQNINDYNILWTPNTGANTVSNPTIPNPTANPVVTTNYVITVTDGGICSGTDTVIVQVDNSSIAAGPDVNGCPGTPTTLTATVTGTPIPGPGAVTWRTISGTVIGTGTSVNVSPSVTTTYVVSLSGGACPKRDTITVNVTDLTITPAVTHATCNGANNGKVRVTSTGVAPFTFTWSASAATGNVDSAVNLQPGVYSISVSDANGCSGSATAQVTEPSPVSLNPATITNTTCFGGSNGSITVNPTGGTPGYTYQWSGGLPPNQTVSSLQSGSYQVTVRDANQCSVTGSMTVAQPPQIVFSAATIQDVRCFNGNTGRITVNVSGGAGGYTYSWSHNAGLNSATASNLMSGNYTVDVTDGAGCSVSASYTVSQPANGLTFNASSITNVTCFGGSDGAATVNPTGGVTPYNYLWTPSGQTTQTANGLSAQTYTVVVTDDSLCTATTSVVVNQPSQTSITGNVTNVSCNGDSDGAIDITVTNGVPAFTFLWSTGATTQNVASLIDGGYQVTVTDNTNCTQSASFTVTEPTLLILNAPAITHVLCNGANTGSITANPSGGTGAYTYTWNPSGSAQTISLLAAGNYSVTVRDANNCSVTAAYSVTEPAAPLAFGSPVITHVLCNGLATGSITVSVTGGTGAYSYSWSNGSINSPTVSSLTAGSYTVTVTDANSCTETATHTISEPPAITFGVQNITNVSCFGYNDGSALVSPTGGTGNFNYTWNGVAGSNPQSNLTAGNYIVVVTDGNSCTASTTVVITQPGFFNVSLTTEDATCFSASNGNITATPTGGTSPFFYSWSNGDVNQSAAGLRANSYSVTVTDNNGCSVSSSAVVNEPGEIFFTPYATQVKCPGDKNGTISVTATGGTPPYNYSATQDGVNFIFATNDTIRGLASGTYTVILADNNGCTLTRNVFVPAPVSDEFIYTTDSTSCYGAQYDDGAIHIEGTTVQNMPYTFGVDGGAQSYSGDLYNLSAGNHVVKAVNFWGCSTTIPVIIPEPVQGVAGIIPSDTVIQLGESIPLYSTFSPYSLSSIISYMWQPATGLSCSDCPNPVVSSYSRMTQYTLTITYNNNCMASTSARIQIVSEPDAYVPNSFSPNGDGNNDKWMIYGYNIKTVDLKIFNRWGEKVFETRNPFDGWDGTYKGTLQNPAVFVYEAEITFLDDKKASRVGSISLLR